MATCPPLMYMYMVPYVPYMYHGCLAAMWLCGTYGTERTCLGTLNQTGTTTAWLKATQPGCYW